MMACNSHTRFLNVIRQGRQARQASHVCVESETSEVASDFREDFVADLRKDPLAGTDSFNSTMQRNSAMLRSVLDAEPVKMPEGLVCKNTFFDIPEPCDLIKERPHTWGPPASRVTAGWHLSSSLLAELTDDQKASSPLLAMPIEENSTDSVSDGTELDLSPITKPPGLERSPMPAFYGDTPTPTGICKGTDSLHAPLGSRFADLLAHAVGEEAPPTQEGLVHEAPSSEGLVHEARSSDCDGCNQFGSEEPPTSGSKNHHLGYCKPCAFFHKGGCNSGNDCIFCHLCPPGEKKRRKKSLLNFRGRIGHNANDLENDHQIYVESNAFLPSAIPETFEPRAAGNEHFELLQTLDVPCLPPPMSCPMMLECQPQCQAQPYDPVQFSYALQQDFADSWPPPCQSLQQSQAAPRVLLDLHHELGLDHQAELGPHTSKQLSEEVAAESVAATPNVAIKQSLNPEGCPDMQGNKDSHPEQKSKKGDTTGRAQASREKRQQEKPTLNQSQSATKARAAEERERLRQEVLRLSAQLEAESLVDGKLKGVALRSFRTGVQPR